MTPYYDHGGVTLYNADCRAALLELPDESVHAIITSPPYWALRDYGVEGQIGLEESHLAYVDELVRVFMEARRVLRKDGTLWLNLGDSYAGAPGGWQGKSGRRASRTFTAKIDKEKKGPGLKKKDLVGIPWAVAFALRAAGWWLRIDNVWAKLNPMPESVDDRPTRAHEMVFLLSKSARYFYDKDAVRKPLSPKTKTSWGSIRHPMRGDDVAHRGVKAAKIAKDMPLRGPKIGADGEPMGSNLRSVWPIASSPFDGAHFAVYPEELVEPMILAGCPLGGVVLDPFAGAGTTLAVAKRLGRKAIGIDLSREYCALAVSRLDQDTLPLTSKRTRPTFAPSNQELVASLSLLREHLRFDLALAEAAIAEATTPTKPKEASNG